MSFAGSNGGMEPSVLMAPSILLFYSRAHTTASELILEWG